MPAANLVPFKGILATQFQIEFGVPQPWLATITVAGQGKASHLGRSTASTSNEIFNLVTGEATATYTLTGANGDTAVLEMEFQATKVAGGVTFAGYYIVTGGTGRFAAATGSGSMSGLAFFTSATTGVGSFGFSGTISSPGRYLLLAGESSSRDSARRVNSRLALVSERRRGSSKCCNQSKHLAGESRGQTRSDFL